MGPRRQTGDAAINDDIIFSDATGQEVSPVEVAEASLDRIRMVAPAIIAIVALAGGAIDEAKRAEAAIIASDDVGPPHGVPFKVKDC